MKLASDITGTGTQVACLSCPLMERDAVKRLTHRSGLSSPLLVVGKPRGSSAAPPLRAQALHPGCLWLALSLPLTSSVTSLILSFFM